MIFQYGREPVLIQWIEIGFEATMIKTFHIFALQTLKGPLSLSLSLSLKYKLAYECVVCHHFRKCLIFLI